MVGGVYSGVTGGVNSGSTINSGGTEYVEGSLQSGVLYQGSAIGATINSGGFQVVLSGGVVIGTIFSGGTQLLDGAVVVVSNADVARPAGP